jgi:DNA-binding transcriptional MocR family regulator
MESSSINTIATHLRRQIAIATPGDALPSTRSLVELHRVSPVTVSRALAQLASEGLVVVRPGAGTFVADPPRALPGREGSTNWQSVPLGDRFVDASTLATMLRPAPDGAIALSAGYLHPDLTPTKALSAAFTHAARRPDVWERPPVSGLQRLRAWFAHTAGPTVGADDVLVTSGGQSALSTAFRAILAPGSPILVESPTYLGALAVARAAGLRPVPVPLDGQGVQPEALAEAFAATGARAFYVQPTYQNPTGTVLSDDRREQLLAVAAAAGAFVIEDDYGRWLAHERPAPPPLVARDRDGRVVHVTSLSKPTSPNLRIGALIAHGPVSERLRSLRVVDDFFPSRLLQEATVELVNGPAWPRHVRALSAGLAVRRDALVRAVSNELPEFGLQAVPAGGIHLWLRLPSGLDDVLVAEAAERAGVLVTPGRPFFAAEPPAPHLRLTYAGAADVAQIEEGVRRLARVIREQSKRSHQ